jgi:hypothetical protein
MNEMIERLGVFDKEIIELLKKSFNNEPNHFMDMFYFNMTEEQLTSYLNKVNKKIKYSNIDSSELLIDLLYNLNNTMILFSENDDVEDVIMNIGIKIEDNILVFNFNNDEIKRYKINLAKGLPDYLSFISSNILRDEIELYTEDLFRFNLNTPIK